MARIKSAIPKSTKEQHILMPAGRINLSCTCPNSLPCSFDLGAIFTPNDFDSGRTLILVGSRLKALIGIVAR